MKTLFAAHILISTPVNPPNRAIGPISVFAHSKGFKANISENVAIFVSNFATLCVKNRNGVFSLEIMTTPETRPSLLLRVRDHDDQAAWDEFSEIYRPVIVRLAIIKGLQTADAEDLAQQVLVSVSRAIAQFEPDKDRARFRTWLQRISENAILNALTRGAPDRASGADEEQLLLRQRPDSSGQDSALLKIEYRREVFAWAAKQIRNEFTDETWMSFWLTSVDGVDVQSAGKQLGRSRGSVYASRSRVMKRLKQKVEEFCFEDHEQSGTIESSKS